MLCPHACKTDRNAGKTGFCGETADLRIAHAGLHFGEEPVITGKGGSGTIFVTGCNLRCAFCQNYQISQQGMGRTVTETEFADICLALQDAGAENINIVTGSHAIPAIAAGLTAAKKRGLIIPVCWNSSAFETPEALELLSGLVNIWLPDLKTLNPQMSQALFATSAYPAAAKKAIRWMISHTIRSIAPLAISDANTNNIEPTGNSGSTDQTPMPEKMFSGVIIRHLFLPGRMNDTVLTLDWLDAHTQGGTDADDNERNACISLMTQYTPVPFAPDECQRRQNALDTFSNRLVSDTEYDKLTKLVISHEFEYLFYQELVPDTEWLPNFCNSKPFSASLSRPIWHWNTGFIHDSFIDSGMVY
jgi:putative pyruvate formate lyase activating enzyme